MSSSPKTLMISAGEASSDMHAAHALRSLKSLGVEFESFGMGADQLQSTGMELTVDCRELSVIGIVDVLINYPRFLKRLKLLRKTMTERKPDLLIIVDYPDFNLKLAETAKALGIPVLFYISPQIWAWRKNRVHRIGERITHMAVLFPFEIDIYQQANIPVTYVGHPLVDDAKSDYTQTEARQALQLSSKNKMLALLPGSRKGELNRNLPVMLQTAELMSTRFSELEFVLPVAATLDKNMVEQMLDESSVTVNLVDARAYDVMRAADAVLSASGTATLETAMLGTPMAVMYVVNRINYAIMSRLIEIDDIGLVNIVAGKRICQEFVQNDANPEKIATELERCLFDKTYAANMQGELAKVRTRMGEGGASGRVASLIKDLLGLT